MALLLQFDLKCLVTVQTTARVNATNLESIDSRNTEIYQQRQCIVVKQQYLIQSFTWQRVEVVDEEHVLCVRVGGDQVELPEELGLRGVRAVHDAQREHLDVGRVGLAHRQLKLHCLPLVRLSVSDDDGHLADPSAGAVEGLLRGLADGRAGVRALAYVGDVADGLLDVLLVHVAGQVELHSHLQAVEHQADAGGVAAHRHAVHQRRHKVLDDLEVLGAHALRAVDDKHQLHGPLLALDATSYREGGIVDLFSMTSSMTSMANHTHTWWSNNTL